ncbi:hypothetical protein JVT61DRAFT_2087 [Boletus reticuloceps]|uniref:FAD/NAD(P)-binding domain-containing protein n=1 Tax=Boletus reticuloceps TaxID=495285 RepID=A0A8I3AB91_9AGAM|nr:hypothetical protein JVT61DRAFT_2087 [Boletus reticuloceps]
MTGMPDNVQRKEVFGSAGRSTSQEGSSRRIRTQSRCRRCVKPQGDLQKADGTTVDREYSLLHVTPPMGPLDFIKNSPVADAAGWVEVNPATLQHVKPEFSNIFAVGDCSSLPTSKTAAAITSQVPVLTENLFSVMDSGRLGKAIYDGYTSCPLLTGYGELMLAEFKYGLEPKETFSSFLGDQKQPRRLFYHLKKDLFPWAYWNFMVNLTICVGGFDSNTFIALGQVGGKWFGPSGPIPTKVCIVKEDLCHWRVQA